MREGYEKTDVSSVGIGLVGFLVIIFVWVLLGIGSTYFHHLKPPAVVTRALPPLPRLQEDPSAELARYLDREHRLLGSYGWIDRSRGLARIPISRAMEMLSHERR